jgi:uncharacterized protein YodC (DUF2158 family)
MKFNPGDIVIKPSGGNRMKVVEKRDGGYDCGWVTERYHEEFFPEDDLIPINQYRSVLVLEKRDDLIGKLLS